jgi:hypothetical protein
MFNKFASNILQDVYNECIFRSLSCKNEEDSVLYKKIAEKIYYVMEKLGKVKE